MRTVEELANYSKLAPDEREMDPLSIEARRSQLQWLTSLETKLVGDESEDEDLEAARGAVAGAPAHGKAAIKANEPTPTTTLSACYYLELAGYLGLLGFVGALLVLLFQAAWHSRGVEAPIVTATFLVAGDVSSFNHAAFRTRLATYLNKLGAPLIAIEWIATVCH